MATYKAHNYSQMILLPISLEDQLPPGTLEWAIHELVEAPGGYLHIRCKLRQ